MMKVKYNNRFDNKGAFSHASNSVNVRKIHFLTCYS